MMTFVKSSQTGKIKLHMHKLCTDYFICIYINCIYTYAYMYTSRHVRRILKEKLGNVINKA